MRCRSLVVAAGLSLAACTSGAASPRPTLGAPDTQPSPSSSAQPTTTSTLAPVKVVDREPPVGVVTVSTTGDLLVVRPDGTVSIEATGVVGFAELIDDDLVYRYADRLVTRPIDGDVETVVATGSAIELTGATRSRGVLGVFYIDRSVPDLPVQWSWTADGRRSGLSYDDDDPTLDDLRYASSDPGCGDDCVVEGGGEDGTVANVIGVHVRMTGADFRSEVLEVPAGLHFFDLSVGVDRAVITFRDGDGELVPLLVIRVGPNEWEWRTLGIDAAGWTTLQSITEN